MKFEIEDQVPSKKSESSDFYVDFSLKLLSALKERVQEHNDKNEKKKGQGNSNSGIFFMRTYELQVLDCAKTETYADGMTAAIYGQQPPLFNACNPSREWNSYDIVFEAPKFDADGKLTKDVKPGNRMHYYKMFNVAGLNETKQTFTAEELDYLAEYLLTLK